MCEGAGFGDLILRDAAAARLLTRRCEIDGCELCWSEAPKLDPIVNVRKAKKQMVLYIIVIAAPFFVSLEESKTCLDFPPNFLACNQRRFKTSMVNC